MSRKRCRRTVRPLINAIDMAIDRASKLSATQRADLMAPARHAIDAIARGQGSADVWQQLADVFNIAEALCELRIAGNLASTINAAQAALASVMTRVHASRGWTLYGPELAALHEGLWLHGVQLEHCSAGEHLRAIEIVTRRIRGALAGNASPRARVHAAVAGEAQP